MATPNGQSDERTPLLPSADTNHGLPHVDSDRTPEREKRKHDVVKLTVSSVLTLLFISAIVAVVTIFEEGLPRDPEKAALSVLESAPVLDGHIDLPELVRVVYKNNISSFNLHERMPAHVDIPRLKRGHVGGFFWSVYVSCKTFMLATSVADIKEAFRVGKVASLIGVEGAHQIGNSLAVLRQYHAVGARYLTLTHSCNNAFADSAGISTPVPPTHGGL
ncbi:hypothetical protein FRC07_012902, partial [Ceratobasidium sp. 392]